MGVSTQLNYFWFNLFILFFCFSISSIYGSEDDCVYTVYVRTSSKIKAGTDSIISLTLYNANGYGIRINNLEAWGGLMGPGYNYFERGNLDIFSGRGPCLNGPICKMNLTSDGTGSGHGWYCNYVEVTVTGVHRECHQQHFEVEQWIATDHSPYQLTFIKNLCRKTKSGEYLSVSAEDLPASVENLSFSGEDLPASVENLPVPGEDLPASVVDDESNSVEVEIKGVGEMRIFASQKPSTCKINGEAVPFEYGDFMVKIDVPWSSPSGSCVIEYLF